MDGYGVREHWCQARCRLSSSSRPHGPPGCSACSPIFGAFVAGPAMPGPEDAPDADVLTLDGAEACCCRVLRGHGTHNQHRRTERRVSSCSPGWLPAGSSEIGPGFAVFTVTRLHCPAFASVGLGQGPGLVAARRRRQPWAVGSRPAGDGPPGRRHRRGQERHARRDRHRRPAGRARRPRRRPCDAPSRACRSPAVTCGTSRAMGVTDGRLPSVPSRLMRPVLTRTNRLATRSGRRRIAECPDRRIAGRLAHGFVLLHLLVSRA